MMPDFKELLQKQLKNTNLYTHTFLNQGSLVAQASSRHFVVMDHLELLTF